MSQHTVMGTHVVIRDSAGPAPKRSKARSRT
jgi:hypothetical protein